MEDWTPIHKKVDIMKKSERILWAEGYESSPAPAQQPGEPFSGELWVFDDDGNNQGTSEGIMMVYSEAEDGVVSHFSTFQMTVRTFGTCRNGTGSR